MVNGHLRCGPIPIWDFIQLNSNSYEFYKDCTNELYFKEKNDSHSFSEDSKVYYKGKLLTENIKPNDYKQRL